jgi:hypothetical protein
VYFEYFKSLDHCYDIKVNDSLLFQKLQEDMKYIDSKQKIIPSKLPPIKQTMVGSEYVRTSKGNILQNYYD